MNQEQTDLARRVREHMPLFAGKRQVADLLAEWLIACDPELRYDDFMGECGMPVRREAPGAWRRPGASGPQFSDRQGNQEAEEPPGGGAAPSYAVKGGGSGVP